MIGLLRFFFIVLCFILAIFIYLQQGKGDMGLGALGGGAQTLFGGSGGQEFFERATWTMVALFILIALALSIFKTSSYKSRLKGFQATENTKMEQKKPMLPHKGKTTP